MPSVDVPTILFRAFPGMTKAQKFMALYGNPDLIDLWALSAYDSTKVAKYDYKGNHEARIAAWLAQEHAWRMEVRKAVLAALGRPLVELRNGSGQPGKRNSA